MSVGFIRFANAANLVTAVFVCVWHNGDRNAVIGYFCNKDRFRGVADTFRNIQNGGLLFERSVPAGISIRSAAWYIIYYHWDGHAYKVMVRDRHYLYIIRIGTDNRQYFQSYNIEGRKEIRAEVMGVAADTGITGVCGGHIAFIPTDGK